jgi:hypothetical protein
VLVVVGLGVFEGVFEGVLVGVGVGVSTTQLAAQEAANKFTQYSCFPADSSAWPNAQVI